MSNKIPIGTKVRAIKRVTIDANEDHPSLLLAEIGEAFIIDRYNDVPGDYVFKTKYGDMVLYEHEFEVINENKET